jgi:hypothetical protein
MGWWVREAIVWAQKNVRKKGLAETEIDRQCALHPDWRSILCRTDLLRCIKPLKAPVLNRSPSVLFVEDYGKEFSS